MKKYKKDFIVIIVLVTIAILSYFAINHLGSGKGEYVQIFIGEQMVEELPLNIDTKYSVTQDDLYNTVVISQGAVSVRDADCPDKLCVKQGQIKKSGESIICLPHKVVIKITGKSRK